MAIAAANVAFDGNGPSASGQVIAQSGLQGNAAQMLLGTATFTGDGSATSATLNYIDGTAALNFTPSMILAFRIGGTATASISVVSVVDNADSGKTAVINFSAAPGAAATVKVAVLLMK